MRVWWCQIDYEEFRINLITEPVVEAIFNALLLGEGPSSTIARWIPVHGMIFVTIILDLILEALWLLGSWPRALFSDTCIGVEEVAEMFRLV